MHIHMYMYMATSRNAVVLAQLLAWGIALTDGGIALSVFAFTFSHQQNEREYKTTTLRSLSDETQICPSAYQDTRRPDAILENEQKQTPGHQTQDSNKTKTPDALLTFDILKPYPRHVPQGHESQQSQINSTMDQENTNQETDAGTRHLATKSCHRCSGGAPEYCHWWARSRPMKGSLESSGKDLAHLSSSIVIVHTLDVFIRRLCGVIDPRCFPLKSKRDI